MSVTFTQICPSLSLATRIASEGFVQPESDALREDVRQHLRYGKIFSAFDTEIGRTVGFAIFDEDTFLVSNRRETVLYLSGIILEPGYQGKGFAAAAVEAVQYRATHCRYLALRTQSSRMWSAGKKLVTHWFPHPERETPDEICMVGKAAAERFARSCFPVTVGAYGGPLYGEKPVHRDVKLQCWWDSLCDFERGDAVFCIGEFPPAPSFSANNWSW